MESVIKSKTRRAIMLVIACMAIMCSMAFINGSAYADSNNELALGGQMITLNVTSQETYNFTPEEAGYYNIRTSKTSADCNFNIVHYDEQAADFDFYHEAGMYEDCTMKYTYWLDADKEYSFYFIPSEKTTTLIQISKCGTSGKCGDNLTWNYDHEKKTLEISGNGEMYDMDYGEGKAFEPVTETTSDDIPWDGFEIDTLILGDDVTSIGAYAFWRQSVKNIEVNNPSLETIGYYAFYGSGLTKLVKINSIKTISDGAFADCFYLNSAVLGGNVSKIGKSAFIDCFELASITIPKSVTAFGANAFDKGTKLKVYYSSKGEAYAKENGYSYTVLDEPASNSISVPKTSVSLTRKTTAQKYTIEATPKISAKLSYKSSTSKVTVSSKGVVTIPEKYVGKFTITITSAASSKAKAATKKITFTVKPNKTSIVSLTNGSTGVLKAKWEKKSGITGYEIQYATDSSFSDAKKIKVKDPSTVTKTLTSKLEEKRIIYVRIRTYKTLSSTTLYSSWSKTKAIFITKY